MYGRQYWEQHQAALGLPPIEVRARLDLAERCQYWLGYLLRYMLPTGSALEIGCSHGAFVKLLRLAGFDAIGMEMSPEVIRESERRFGISVIQGPLAPENATSRFDLIALFDVMEHVADPVGTVSAIVDRLSDKGMVVIQTPKHDAIRDPKWQMYLAPEHTVLYSSAGLIQLLNRAGLVHTKFEPAIFPHDMFVFASREPLAVNPPEAIEARLLATPDGRIALAMQDLFREAQQLRALDPARRYGPSVLAPALVRSFATAIARRLGRKG